MRQLTAAGQQIINDIASRHGFSVDGTQAMLDAVINGNGSMAQFSHADFSGSGQWMRGGMTMVSDMFNHHLKSRVDSLCSELSNLVASQPDLVRSSSGGGGTADWWPADLRWPNSTGAQNGVRYAYFAQARRLVIDLNGTVTVYDTQDHNIGGFSQQQSVGGTLGFNSQYGLIDVASLPVVSSNGQPPAATWQAPAPQAMPAAVMAAGGGSGNAGAAGDIFATIERLAELRAKGVLSDDEFSAKKAELLSRL